MTLGPLQTRGREMFQLELDKTDEPGCDAATLPGLQWKRLLHLHLDGRNLTKKRR